MSRKSLRTGALLLGLLLVTCSSAYADAVAITSVSVSNFQLVAASGTVVFSTPQTSASGAAANSFGEEAADSSQGPTLSQASTSVTFAGAGGVSDSANLLVTANSNAMLSGCMCSAESEGLASLTQSFTIVGGSGNVDVTLSALLQTVQNLVTDPSSLFAASDARITLEVVDVRSFSFDSRLRVGPNELTALETQRQLSEIFTLQFGQQYNLRIFVGANSRAGQNEIPEPATVVLLVSGLGFMAGFVRKRRSVPPAKTEG
jgi:hypothetical protein